MCIRLLPNVPLVWPFELFLVDYRYHQHALCRLIHVVEVLSQVAPPRHSTILPFLVNLRCHSH